MNTTIVQQRTLVIGTGSFVRELLHEIALRPKCGYQIVGLVARERQTTEIEYGTPMLGSLENLNAIIQVHQPAVMIVALPHNGVMQSDHQLLEARVCRNIKVEQAEAVYERLTGKLAIQSLAPRGVIYSDDFWPAPLTLLSTRLLSLCSAVLGLVLLGPLMATIALLIKLDTPGPVLFVQERVGFGGKSFRLMKFRTMRPAEQRISEWEDDNKHRITRVGFWLRKFRLDELPQFFNILKGDMNLVGPRPHPYCSFEMFVLVSRNMPESGMQIPFYSLRYSVLPGITGWAQVRYLYANNIKEEIEKLKFDLYYIKHYSIWFDIRIIFETIRIVVAGHDGVSGNSAQPDAAGDDPIQPVPLHLQQAKEFIHEKARYSR
jgi:exopolysaccharide biosynthesis polyprenyl glycosylphosphotransferase